MMSVLIYYATLLLTVAIAFWRGGKTERQASLVALVASILTSAVTPFPIWTNIETSIFIIDVLVLLAFWWIAWHSERFWPYWITGWQLIAIFGHIQKFMFVEILARPYSLLSVYIAYPMLMVIVYASLTSGRSKQEFVSA